MNSARDGATVLYLAVDGKPAAVIAIADPIKGSTQAALGHAACRGRAHRHADRR